MALFSNTLSVIRQYLSSAVGDLLTGQCGTTGATTTKIYAPFLWKADDYYNENFYEAYVYAGTNIGVTKRVTDWVLNTFLATVHSAYDNACDATSYVELHHIFTEDDYRKAINLAIESLAGKYLIDLKDESTITLSDDTYEYALPTTFLYLYRVITEETAATGTFDVDDEVDVRDWSIIKSYPPKLKLHDTRYSITADKDLRLEGQGTQPVVDDDTDIIYLPPSWVVNKAITFLPQNKIQQNYLTETYRRALIASSVEPSAGAHPEARRIVE